MKPGDIVKLKSGGPNMTVEEVPSADGAKRVNCVWFESQGHGGSPDGEDNSIWELKRDSFIAAVLVLVSVG